ncbi:unnamed protein product [Sphagnum tenellum]
MLARSYVLMGVAMVLLTIRSPAVTLISFQYKNRRDTRRNEETRSMRLQKVLKEALEESELRWIRNQLQMDSTI